jgi:hypothetical protein
MFLSVQYWLNHQLSCTQSWTQKPQLSRNFQRHVAPHPESSPMTASVEAMPIPNAANAITMRILVVRFPGALVIVDEVGRT